MQIEIDDPERADVLALLEEHLRHMRELSPPESVHALDPKRLKTPDITFWTVRDAEGLLLGTGALREIDATHGEVKSMRTPDAQRRRGAGRAMLAHIVGEARRRGYERLSLETGSQDGFAPARRLYASAGFAFCGPFGDYGDDPHSAFMTLLLADATDVQGKAVREIIDFWRRAGEEGLWFRKDAGFDREFAARFKPWHLAAARGDLDGWAASPEGALALLILLDQYPRNAFRGTARVYATDEKARKIARESLAAGHVSRIEDALRLFFCLPFAHSELLEDQDLSVALNSKLGEEARKHAEGHRDIIRRFGRFPHRNPLLGRVTTREEQAFLDAGGFAG